jgi:hypothetical protein
MIFRILFFELKAGMHSFALDVMSTSESSQRREIEAMRTCLYRTVSTAPTVNDGIKDYKLVHLVARNQADEQQAQVKDSVL